MGIESDQLVFDYVSRVADVAHRTSMSAAERARLVAEVRADIERRRAAAGGAESPAAVRRILRRLGTPETVVARATGEVGPLLAAGDGDPEEDAGGLRGRLPGMRRRATRPAGPRAAADGRAGATPPHLASEAELGPESSDPNWWKKDTGPYGPPVVSGGPQVGGFVGGIEMPEMLEAPPVEQDGDEAGRPGAGVDGAGPAEDAGQAADGQRPEGDATPSAPAEEKPTGRRPVLAALLRSRRGDGASVPRVGGVVEWLAVAALLAGAVLGELLPMAVGWVLAYWAPRLSRPEAKWAAMGVPGTVAAAFGVWLWGRADGRWGEPIPSGETGEAVTAVLPVLLRTAAVASALFLVWRGRRPR